MTTDRERAVAECISIGSASRSFLWLSEGDPPQYEGGHWFYSRNTGLQRQAVVFKRETLNSPETVVLDPNSLSPDGSIALSAFFPSPDGRHFAYGSVSRRLGLVDVLRP